MRREAVPEGVARGALVEACRSRRVLHGLLDGRFVQVVQDRMAGRRGRAGARRREEVLPGKACRRVGHLVPQGEREVDLATAGVELGAVAPLDLLELGLQAVAGPGGQE